MVLLSFHTQASIFAVQAKMDIGASCTLQRPQHRTQTLSNQQGVNVACQSSSNPKHAISPIVLEEENFATMVEDQIPVFDLADLKRSDSHTKRAKEALVIACKEWGVFQVTNHGVSLELVQKFRKQALDLFSLPLEVKERVSRKEGSLWGYHFRKNSGPLEVFQVPCSDDPLLAEYANKLYPNYSQDLRAMYKEANLVFHNLAMEILDLLIEGLAVDAKHFDAHKREAQGILRANYYHCSNSEDRILGLVPHVDGNLFTILHQEDVCGLEVLKDGRWVPIPPQKDAFCINVADMLQVLSNGQFKGVQHRAVVSKTNPRLSVAYFVIPAEYVTIVSAPELVDPDHPPLYRPFTWAECLEAQKDPSRPHPSILPVFENRISV